MGVRAWLSRYAPAEAAGITGALLATAPLDEPAAAAIAGTVGETVGFYAMIFARDVRAGGRPAAVVRDMVLEFGPAELLDTLLVRPGAMYLATRALGTTTTGVVVGKLAADVVFYAVAIIGYELRRSRVAASKDLTGEPPPG
ncbi:hypothetical protein Ais01nite_08870 [Asanoa ishikariensis]|uniref:Uncharacterized protein n=1 Tax=Asanoa ishikariensis TaxID=137265 RepID=A0A1H3T8E8_9ACTN|nr:hypothetical protein [Asanoa ishikariensis]GIF62852.1 hypothetical protein Ais01nite_08870 [Asanoa ishikariensis]SDZ46613.1 hypothetical protein SAMN05421684_5346 [Asanoa ishikariensis]